VHILQIAWFHNDKPVKDTKDFELLMEGDRCSLVIHEVYLEDSGEYKCTARNTSGMAHTSCRLMVERKSIDTTRWPPKSKPLSKIIIKWY